MLSGVNLHGMLPRNQAAATAGARTAAPKHKRGRQLEQPEPVLPFLQKDRIRGLLHGQEKQGRARERARGGTARH